MADKYEIYIHSDQKATLADKTEPQDHVLGGVFESGKISSLFTGGAGGYINTGVSELAKAIPAVAMSVALVKGADKVLTAGFQHLETYTGNYQYAMNFNNFKTGIGMALNPIGTAMKLTNLTFQQKVINERQAQVRSLLGETNKVGV